MNTSQEGAATAFELHHSIEKGTAPCHEYRLPPFTGKGNWGHVPGSARLSLIWVDKLKTLSLAERLQESQGMSNGWQAQHDIGGLRPRRAGLVSTQQVPGALLCVAHGIVLARI